MSLDVYLKRKRTITYEDTVESVTEWEYVYEDNITHNLGSMANAAGIYTVCWRPEQLFINAKANDLIQYLEKGYKWLISNPDEAKKYNSENGWGLYEHFVLFVKNYLEACKKWPNAIVEISR